MHPYRRQPPYAFWSRAVTDAPWGQVPFVPEPDPFIDRNSRIATAGSCFAANLLRWMPRLGLEPFFTEEAPSYFTPEEVDAHHYREFGARYGNLYTVRQLRQLVEEATGVRPMVEQFHQDRTGVFDLLRPHVRPGGFVSAEEARLDRRYHLTCVERLLRESDVFVFTLGLTEAWIDADADIVFPVCPGTVAGRFDPEVHVPVNFGYPSVLEDLTWTIEAVARINPRLRWILTVSPVPLVATHTRQSVIVATTYSKSVLRAVCGAMTNHPSVNYFPSFEIISSAQSFGQYLASDLREVTDRGIAHVMDVFRTSYVGDEAPVARDGEDLPRPATPPSETDHLATVARALADECDELLNEPT